MTIKQIPFDVSLAIKAWRTPDKNGVVYWLTTKQGVPVLPTHYFADFWKDYPFMGQYFPPRGKKTDRDMVWMEDGKAQRDMSSIDDLELFKVTV